MKTNRMTSGGSHVPNNLPPRPHPFINRKKEIQQVITILLQDKTPVVFLTGMGGIGKTSLALEVAYRLLDKGKFAGGIVWSPVRDLQSFDDPIGAAGHILGIPAPEVGARLNSQPCLIVFDGFDELQASHTAKIERFSEIFPAKSKLLITSRSQPNTSLPATVIQVGLFNERSAKEFLAALGVPPDKEISSADREIMDEIIRNTGYHPLALKLASNLIQSNFAEALKDFQQTIAVSDSANDGRRGAALRYTLASMLQARGEYKQALKYLEASLRITRAVGDKAGEGALLNNISQIYAARGDYETALGYLERSLKIRQEIGDKLGEGATLNNISQIYIARGDYETARTYLEASLKISQELGDKKTESRILNSLSLILFDSGLLNVEQGSWYDALCQFEESLSIRRQGDDLNARAEAIYQIARVHHLIGNLDKARTHYRDALRLYEHTGNEAGVAICKTGLGRLMLQMGFPDEALNELNFAKQIYRQRSDDRHIAEIDELLRVANQVKEGQPA